MHYEKLIDAIYAGEPEFDPYFQCEFDPLLKCFAAVCPMRDQNLIDLMPTIAVAVQVMNASDPRNLDCGMTVNQWLANAFGATAFFETNQIVA